MATLKDIKLRMGSVKNTQQITKAMKMVAASKMKRAEDKIKAARPYSDKLRSMVANLSSGMDDNAHPLLEKREGGKAIVVLITSDKGLCGGLNNNLCKTVNKQLSLNDQEFDEIEIVSVGRKGREYFSKQPFPIIDRVADLKDEEMIAMTSDIMMKLIKKYENREFDRLYVAFNQFKNVITQEIHVQQVLPVSHETKTTEEEEALEQEFMLEPSKNEILDTILPQYVENQAYTAFLDNNACEHASRMTAMDAATKNAGEMLSALSLQYNRARQAAITTELTEIISGAESL